MLFSTAYLFFVLSYKCDLEIILLVSFGFSLALAWLIGVFFLVGFAVGPALEHGISPYADDYARYMRWRLGYDEEHKLEKQIRLSMQQDRLSKVNACRGIASGITQMRLQRKVNANALAEEQKKLLAG